MINSNSNELAVFLAFEVLLLEAVLVLVDDRLVPDENDEPSDMIELGRWDILIMSGITPENELRNFGAGNGKKSNERSELGSLIRLELDR